MKTTYIIRGYIAFSEQDSWENGCFGPSKHESQSRSDFVVKADSFLSLQQELTSMFKSSDFLLDSCEDDGRLDLQAYQLNAFQCNEMSATSKVKWQEGKIDAWLTCYTFNVERVQSEFSLTELLEQELNAPIEATV